MTELSAPAMLFGVPIDDVTMDTTVERIMAFVAEGRRSGRTHQVATVNVDFLVNAIDHPDLKHLLQHSDLNLADGMPLVWSSRLFGQQLPERVAGSDLVPRLAAESAERPLRLHLFGGAAGVADRALALLLERHPAATITADAGPMISDVEAVDDALIERIRSVDADVLCVALGNPKQERFIAAQRHRLGVPVLIGVGGSFDMLIGDKRRAPKWMQRIGAEWIARAVQDPRRLGPRYAHDIRVFGPHLRRHVAAVRRHRDGVDLTARLDGDRIVVAPSAADDAGTQMSCTEVRDRIGTQTSIAFDFADVDSVAATAHAALVDVVRTGRREGARFENVPWTTSLDRCLDDYGTAAWFQSLSTDSASGSPAEERSPTVSARRSRSETSTPSIGLIE